MYRGLVAWSSAQYEWVVSVCDENGEPISLGAESGISRIDLLFRIRSAAPNALLVFYAGHAKDQIKIVGLGQGDGQVVLAVLRRYYAKIYNHDVSWRPVL